MPRQFYGNRYTSTPWRQRFWAKVRKTKGCWIWTCQTRPGRRPREKRAVFKAGGRWWAAARYLWLKTRGPIPRGKQVLHYCDNPLCVRPSHLWLGTQLENIEDMRQKGRARNNPSRGELSTSSKLTEAAARDIRRMRRRGVLIATVQKKYPMSQAQISRIANGKRWAHLHSRG